MSESSLTIHVAFTEVMGKFVTLGWVRDSISDGKT